MCNERTVALGWYPLALILVAPLLSDKLPVNLNEFHLFVVIPSNIFVLSSSMVFIFIIILFCWFLFQLTASYTFIGYSLQLYIVVNCKLPLLFWKSIFYYIILFISYQRHFTSRLECRLYSTLRVMKFCYWIYSTYNRISRAVYLHAPQNPRLCLLSNAFYKLYPTIRKFHKKLYSFGGAIQWLLRNKNLTRLCVYDTVKYYSYFIINFSSFLRGPFLRVQNCVYEFTT